VDFNSCFLLHFLNTVRFMNGELLGHSPMLNIMGNMTFSILHVYSKQINQSKQRSQHIPKSPLFKLNKTFREKVLTIHGLLRKPPTCRKSMTIFMTYCYIGYTSPRVEFDLATLVVISTDCTGSCKSSYHAITTTTASLYINITFWLKTTIF
jgi:hypothetical protein